jgi:hypothetical protein
MRNLSLPVYLFHLRERRRRQKLGVKGEFRVVISPSHVKVVKVLVDTYPEGVKGEDRDKRLPLHVAAENYATLEVVKLLVEAYPEGVKAHLDYQGLPLDLAASSGAPVDVLTALVLADLPISSGPDAAPLDGHAFSWIGAVKRSSADPDKWTEVLRSVLQAQPSNKHCEALMFAKDDQGVAAVEFAGSEAQKLLMRSSMGIGAEWARVLDEGGSGSDGARDGNEDLSLHGVRPQRCICKGSCDNKRCACIKAGRHCNPELCSCCTLSTSPICSNVSAGTAYYYAAHPPLPDLRPYTVGEGSNSLVVASWNIQSFGFNMFYGAARRLSKPFLAAIDKVASFVLHHKVDLLFIQETIESAALDYLVTHLNSTDNAVTFRVEWVPHWVAVGQGFNIDDAEVRPDELAAVIHKDFRSHSLPWQVEHPLQVIEFIVEGLHASFTELRDRFKRHPAYMTVRVGTELTCFAVLHLVSDGGMQTLRLNKEIEALPGLAARLKEMTGADNVVLLGDFNRDPNTVVFYGLTRSGHFPALKEGRTNHSMRSDRQTKPHLYDNFWLPSALLEKAAVAIGEERWMKLEHGGVALERPISDHRPVILELDLSPA